MESEHSETNRIDRAQAARIIEWEAKGKTAGEPVSPQGGAIYTRARYKHRPTHQDPHPRTHEVARDAWIAGPRTHRIEPKTAGWRCESLSLWCRLARTRPQPPAARRRTATALQADAAPTPRQTCVGGSSSGF